MKLSQFLLLIISTIAFNAHGMDDGNLVAKEKRAEEIDGNLYTFKVFRQSRTSYDPVELFISRSKNKKTGNKSYSGGVSSLTLNESRLEYVSYMGGTTDLFNNEFTESKWTELKKTYKTQQLTTKN